MIRHTSRLAYLQIIKEGNYDRDMRKIIKHLSLCGVPRSRSEISDATGLPINIVSGRVNDLIHKKYTLEEVTPKRKCTITRMLITPVRLKQNPCAPVSPKRVKTPVEPVFNTNVYAQEGIQF